MAIKIEGLSPQDILQLPDEELDELILTDEPVAFRAGSAEILGQFAIKDDRLILELAHIDGGGEGILPTLASIGKRLAESRNIPQIEWIVHATNCASPNPKLLRVLQRRGFTVRDLPGKGNVYHQIQTVEGAKIDP